MWITREGAFEPIIPAELYVQARAIIQARHRHLSDDELLDRLRSLLTRHGNLSGLLIDDAEEMPSSSVYTSRFGGLYLTFILADCSGFDLRSTARGIKAVAIQMLKDNPNLQGWFMRLEVTPTPKRPGMFHPHVHVLAHYKPESFSDGNSLSLRKWQTAWKSGLPEDARTRRKPVVIEPVDSSRGAVGYICKSPWVKAGKQGRRRIESYVIQMLDVVAALAHLPSFKGSGTLDVS